MGQVHVNLGFLLEALGRPERIGRVLNAGRRGEVGFAPLLVHGHAAGHLVKPLKVLRPKELVEVEIAVVALRRARIAAQEIERGAVRQDDRIALQLHARHFVHERADVLFEDVRLGLTGRQENLVSPSLQRIYQRLAGKVPSGTDLAAFENGPRALLAALPPAQLVLEQRIEESAFQLLHLFL